MWLHLQSDESVGSIGFKINYKGKKIANVCDWGGKVNELYVCELAFLKTLSCKMLRGGQETSTMCCAPSSPTDLKACVTTLWSTATDRTDFSVSQKKITQCYAYWIKQCLLKQYNTPSPNFIHFGILLLRPCLEWSWTTGHMHQKPSVGFLHFWAQGAFTVKSLCSWAGLEDARPGLLLPEPLLDFTNVIGPKWS